MTHVATAVELDELLVAVRVDVLLADGARDIPLLCQLARKHLPHSQSDSESTESVIQSVSQSVTKV